MGGRLKAIRTQRIKASNDNIRFSCPSLDERRPTELFSPFCRGALKLPSLPERAVAAGHRGGEDRNKSEYQGFNPENAPDMRNVLRQRRKCRIVSHRAAPAYVCHCWQYGEEAHHGERGYLRPEEQIGRIVCPAFRRENGARKSDNNNCRSQDAVPQIGAG